MRARRRWALPLVPLYRGVLAAQALLRAAGLGKERRLEWPVISVGSVSAGGAGKTPLVIALAKLLSERGWTVDVLSRGYGRGGRGVERVELAKPDAARRYGDEPTVVAGRTGVPVWVGVSRYEAGLAAEQAEALTPKPVRVTEPRPEAQRMKFEGELLDAGGEEEPEDASPRCAHLLDDGFQHRGLARSFELAVVTAEDLVDGLLPAGNLREPLSALRRADAIAVREEELEVVEAPLRALAGADVPLWTVRRTLRFPAPLGIFSAGLRPLGFCALARPESFAAMLTKAGCGLVDTVIFGDHHRYDDGDIGELITLALKLAATGLVTTEKDAVKLSPAMRARLEAEVGPLMVVALDAAFVFESPVVRQLEARLRARRTNTQVVDEVRSR